MTTKTQNTIDVLEPQARFFTDRQKAFDAHYSQGGTLWKRKEGAPASVKPWANGNIQDWMQGEWYTPFMVNGGRP